MTGTSTAFLVLAVAFSAADWVAVARGNTVLEWVSKPVATLMFLGVAASLDVPHGEAWWWRVAALILCIAGDVFLMLPRDAFVPGLASFAGAQVMFALSFATPEMLPGRFIVGIIIVVPLAAVLARRFVNALRNGGHDGLVVPVTVYLVLISAMTVASIAGGSAPAIAGAVSFMVSDSLIAESRFVENRRWHGTAIMVTYHAALAGLVLGLL